MDVSVISGAYNLEHCFSFRKSIESILSQSLRDFELIICDDGSSDRTWEILNEYAEKDRRIKLLRNEHNMGLAASLNRGIEAASGQFIARHDCDDYSSPDRLEKQLEYMKAHDDVSVLGTQAYLFDKNGVWGKARFPLKIENKDFLFVSPFKHGSVMFRKEALLRAGCYRVARETYRAEDYDLFMTMQTFCKCENMDEFLYYFCEDEKAVQRRKYIYRLDEAKVRYAGFKKLGLLPEGIPYIIKPMIVGLIPPALLERFKNVYYDRED